MVKHNFGRIYSNIRFVYICFSDFFFHFRVPLKCIAYLCWFIVSTERNKRQSDLWSDHEQRPLWCSVVLALPGVSGKAAPPDGGLLVGQLGDFLSGSSGGGFQCDQPRPPCWFSEVDPVSNFSPQD